MSGQSWLITCVRLMVVGAFLFGLWQAGPVAGDDLAGSSLTERDVIQNDRDASLVFSHPADSEKNFARDACPNGTWETATSDGNWTDDIWGLPGGGYPSNIPPGVPNLCARIEEGVRVTLDETISVNGLDVRPNGTLEATDEDSWDLAIVSSGGILNDGDILVDYAPTISVPTGQMVLQDDGKYKALAGGTGTSAQAVARGVLLLPIWPDETYQMTISQEMGFTCTDDFVLDGSTLVDPWPKYGGQGRGGKTPPVLRIGAQRIDEHFRTDRTLPPPLPESLTIQGSLEMLEVTTVLITCRGTSVSITGDFVNHNWYPSEFNWVAGKLTIQGTGDHVFQVAGLDLGNSDEGFDTNEHAISDTNRHSNFSMGIIEVANDNTVWFKNDYVNTAGTGPCEEALYVDKLIINDTAHVIIDKVRVYAHSVTGGGTVTLTGHQCAELVVPGPRAPSTVLCVPILPIPTVSEWGLVVTTLLFAIAGSIVFLRRRLRCA